MSSKLTRLFKLQKEIQKSIETIQKDRRYVKLHTIADLEMIKLLGNLQKRFTPAQLETALEKLSSSVDLGSEDQVWDALGMEEYLAGLRTTLQDSIESAVRGGYGEGVAAMTSYKIIGTVDTHGILSTNIAGKDVEIDFGFNMRNPLALKYIETSSAALVKDVSDDVRKAIKTVLSDAFQFGGSPREQAQSLKEFIGLTQKDQLLIEKYRAALTAHGLSETEVNALVQELHDKKLTERCENIARTETITAANEGQRLAWIQAKEAGLLSNDWVREWVVTPDDRLCPVCSAMKGQTATIEGTFTSAADGSQISGPTLHPRCRCCTRLIEKV